MLDPNQFLDEHGEELQRGIIKEELIPEIFEFILECATQHIKYMLHKLSMLYYYLAKYKYQPDDQTTTLVGSIRRSSRELSLILNSSKSLRNKITTENQMTVYIDAIKSISNEMIDSIPESIPEEFDIDKIVDSTYIESYLNKYASAMEVKFILNIK